MISLSYSCFDKKVVKNVNTRDEFIELSLPVVFAVSGYSDSGKTWLIEKLINFFILSGFSTGVLKHDGQDHIRVAEDTDTQRYKNAGAVITAVYSDSQYLFEGGKVSPGYLIDLFRHHPEPPDIIILEGFKRSGYPKVEVLQRGRESEADPETLICISSDDLSPDKAGCPVFKADDVRGIFNCILRYFGMDEGADI